MNIAQSIISYYDSKDFKNSYSSVLFEQFNDSEQDIINRIIDLFNVSNYETEKYLSNHKIINRDQSKLIYDFISENIELFIKSFNNYYVGYTSLDSISFGEQEEQLTGLYNHKTGKDYNINYLKKLFEKEGFYVSREYAYYDLSSSGLRIELINNELNEFLINI